MVLKRSGRVIVGLTRSWSVMVALTQRKGDGSADTPQEKQMMMSAFIRVCLNA